MTILESLIKIKFKTKFWPYKGHLSAKREEKKENKKVREKIERNKKKLREIKQARQEQGYFKEITWLS